MEMRKILKKKHYALLAAVGVSFSILAAPVSAAPVDENDDSGFYEQEETNEHSAAAYNIGFADMPDSQYYPHEHISLMTRSNLWALWKFASL